MSLMIEAELWYLGYVMGFSPLFYMLENTHNIRSYGGWGGRKEHIWLVPTELCAKPSLNIYTSLEYLFTSSETAANKPLSQSKESQGHSLCWMQTGSAIRGSHWQLEITKGEREHKEGGWKYPLAEKQQRKHSPLRSLPPCADLPLQQSQGFHLRSASENENKMFQFLRNVSWDRRQS